MVADVDALQNLYLRGLEPPLVALLAGAVSVGAAAAFLPAAGLVLAGGLLAAGWPCPRWREPSDRGRAGVRRPPAASSRPSSSSCSAGRPSSSRSAARGRRSTGFVPPIARWSSWPAATRSPPASPTASGSLVTGLTVAGVLAVAIAAHDHGALNRVLIAMLALLALAAFEAVTPLAATARELSATLAAGRRVLELTDHTAAVRDPARPARGTAGGRSRWRSKV